MSIYPEESNPLVAPEEAVSILLEHLQKIEATMKSDGVWSPDQTEVHHWLMPIMEWVTLVMIPRDTDLLQKGFLPSNYSVGSMAREEQAGGVQPTLSKELLDLLDAYDNLLVKYTPSGQV